MGFNPISIFFESKHLYSHHHFLYNVYSAMYWYLHFSLKQRFFTSISRSFIPPCRNLTCCRTEKSMKSFPRQPNIFNPVPRHIDLTHYHLPRWSVKWFINVWFWYSKYFSFRLTYNLRECYITNHYFFSLHIPSFKWLNANHQLFVF